MLLAIGSAGLAGLAAFVAFFFFPAFFFLLADFFLPAAFLLPAVFNDFFFLDDAFRGDEQHKHTLAEKVLVEICVGLRQELGWYFTKCVMKRKTGVRGPGSEDDP